MVTILGAVAVGSFVIGASCLMHLLSCLRGRSPPWLRFARRGPRGRSEYSAASDDRFTDHPPSAEYSGCPRPWRFAQWLRFAPRALWRLASFVADMPIGNGFVLRGRRW